jgi:hypothetical protein
VTRLPEIKVVRKGTTTNKLTIAKDRIELKVTDKVSAESEKWLLSFAQKVLEEVAKTPSEFTLRGRFRWNEGRQIINLELGCGAGGRKDVKYFYPDKIGLPPAPEDVR